jgi:hypothetical protein
MANRRELPITSKFDEIEKRLIELTSLVHNQNEDGDDVRSSARHVFIPIQSSADCIINMPGFDLRQAQPVSGRSPGNAPE